MMLKVGKSKIQIIFIDFCMFGVRYSAKDGVEKFILFEFFFSWPDKCHHIPSKITFLLDTFMASILDLKINNKVFFSVSFHSLSFHCASKRLLTQWKWRCVRGIPSAERKCFFYFWFLWFLMFYNFQYFIFSTILDFRLLFAECVNILFFLYFFPILFGKWWILYLKFFDWMFACTLKFEILRCFITIIIVIIKQQPVKKHFM